MISVVTATASAAVGVAAEAQAAPEDLVAMGAPEGMAVPVALGALGQGVIGVPQEEFRRPTKVDSTTETDHRDLVIDRTSLEVNQVCSHI